MQSKIRQWILKVERKTQRSRIVAIVGVVAFLVAVPSYAQGANSLRATIPFDFTVGKTTLPAGDYIVGEQSESPTALRIKSADTGGDVIVITSGLEKGWRAIGARAVSQRNGPAEPYLLFHRYGSRHFLAQVWTGNQEGREINKPKVERKMASAGQRVEIVTILAQF